MSGQIKYARQMIDTKKKDWRKVIDYDNIDSIDFRKPFIEVLDKPEYVHLYFDFDSIETEDEYNTVIGFLDGLKDVFGEYTIGGYTNDEVFSELYKYIPNAHHTLSLHVIYYETKIKSSVLIELMKHTKKV